MSTDLTSTLENLAHGVLRLLGQIGRTFTDLLFRPWRFARSSDPSNAASSDYVPPYTFLMIAGYLGIKTLVVVLTRTWTFGREFNFSTGTLQEQTSVIKEIAQLPTLNELLLLGLPLVLAIHLTGHLLRLLLSRQPNPTVRQSLYYAAGLQYLLTALLVVSSNVLEFSESKLGEVLLGVANSPWAWSLALFLPACLLAIVNARAISPPERRAGRGFFLVLPVAALLASSITFALPFVGSAVQMTLNPYSVRDRAVLRSSFVGPQRVDGEQLTAGVFLVNQTPKELFLLSEGALVVTPDRTSWRGRMSDPNADSDVIRLPSHGTAALRFVGARGASQGLTNEASGRIEIMELKSDGTTQALEVYVWKPE